MADYLFMSLGKPGDFDDDIISLVDLTSQLKDVNLQYATTQALIKEAISWLEAFTVLLETVEFAG